MGLLSFGRDVQGYNAYAPIPSNILYSATLTPGTPTSITVPSNFQNWIVAFSYTPGGSVWVDFTGNTAIPPAGPTLSSSTAELLPGARVVEAGSNISVVTDSTAAVDIGISFYAIQAP